MEKLHKAVKEAIERLGQDSGRVEASTITDVTSAGTDDVSCLQVTRTPMTSSRAGSNWEMTALSGKVATTTQRARG
jgi:hypothetical protein